MATAAVVLAQVAAVIADCRGTAGNLMFCGAAALVGVHTVMDAFLVPEPGTRWNDHLLAGSVSLAILAIAVLSYSRLPDGGRAASSLVLGVLMLEGAGLAVADAMEDGPRGDDWTGVLLAPAGVVTCALGVRLLWLSRRRGEHRLLRRGLLLVLAALTTYWVVVPTAVALMATHRPREVAAILDLGRPSRPVQVRTRDGLDLNGRYVPSRNGAAVIVYPGSPSRSPQARMLVRHGYGVLMLDMRGYAASEGDSNMFGWGAARDIDAGVAFLRERADVHSGRIGGLGFSVGGELMIEAAAGNGALRAVIADGAGERSVRESVLRGAAGWFSLPTYAVQTLAVAVLSGDPPPASLMDLTPQIAPRPLLLIGAGHDNGGEDMQPHYYAAAREPKSYWKIPEAGHTGGFEARPREYTQRVLAFFDEALADDRT